MASQGNLLQQIQAAAVDPRIDAASLLRMCLILSYKLNHIEFKEWVNSELTGYKSKFLVPNYRRFMAGATGNFIGPFQSMKNMPLPVLNIREDLREVFFGFILQSGVSEIENLIKSCRGGAINTSIHQDYINLVRDDFYDNFQLVSANKIMQESKLVKIVDVIKTKITLFTLEIESQCPDYDAIKTNSREKKIVNNVYKTIILGDVGCMANGSNDFSQGQSNEI